MNGVLVCPPLPSPCALFESVRSRDPRAEVRRQYSGSVKNVFLQAISAITSMTGPTVQADGTMQADGTVTAPVSGGAGGFDVRVISEFDGSADVVEWWTRAELLCGLRGVSLITVLPLRLTGGAFAVWAQLPAADRTSLEAVKKALYAAFALDEYAAYDAFSNRRLQPAESADVYLADLRRLAELFGGVPDRALACAFVAGLPEAVRQLIRAGSRAESLDLVNVVARARAVLSDDRVAAAAAAAAGVTVRGSNGSRPDPRGYEARSQRRSRRCWNCGDPGHLVAACPRRSGNAPGDSSAPAQSPGQ